MAVVPFFLLGPNTILSLIGLIRGPDKTVPTPPTDWRKARVNVVIPAYNEESTITLCLTSLMEQTLKPYRIIIIDDGSHDKTLEFVQAFCQTNDLKATVIHREHAIGKTPTLKRQAREFEADVEFILDGDTVLTSPNYIERCVEELYKAPGIACACGCIKPFTYKERSHWLDHKLMATFLNKIPSAHHNALAGELGSFGRKISNLYRDVLYTYLQRFIYIGEMAFFGGITNPVGCAVAYRQIYVEDLFEKYEPLLGDDLTNSEDIFIGFALNHKGYRNIQLQDVIAHSQEPRFDHLPRQMYMWSSSFLQSCYYFPALVWSPFKALKRRRYHKKNEKLYGEEIRRKRKIQEPYRQRFGDEWTKEYGRPIGWVILTTLIEKIGFSLIFWIMIILGWWLAIGLTLGLESLVSISCLVIATKNHRWQYFWKGILTIPFRYCSVLLDIFTVVHFALETWVFKFKKWRK